MEKKPEVRFKVDVVITEETLRDYLMQRTYSNAGIIIPTLFGIGFLYLAVTKWGQVDTLQWGAYLLFGLIFLFGVPLNVWSRSRRDVRRNKSLQRPVPYFLDDEGIYYGEGERDVLPWNKIHHIISSKRNVIVYATPKMAFFFPKECIGEDYEEMTKFITGKMEPGRAKFAK